MVFPIQKSSFTFPWADKHQVIDNSLLMLSRIQFSSGSSEHKWHIHLFMPIWIYIFLTFVLEIGISISIIVVYIILFFYWLPYVVVVFSLWFHTVISLHQSSTNFSCARLKILFPFFSDCLLDSTTYILPFFLIYSRLWCVLSLCRHMTNLLHYVGTACWQW